MNELNKEIALELSRSILAGDWSKVDALLAEDFHYVSDGKPSMNKTQYIGFMRDTLCAAMTDMDMQFLRVVAEDKLVAVDYSNAMTHTGTFLGIPPTHRRLLATGQFMREIKDGKVTAEWQTTNALGLMQALGVIQSQSPVQGNQQ